MNDLDALLDKDTPIPKRRASLSSSQIWIFPVWISYGRQFTKGNNKKRR